MSDTTRGGLARLGRRILEVPLFFKLTVANAAVAIGSAAVALLLAVSTLGGTAGALPRVMEFVGVAGALALLAAVAVNVVLTRLALSPLKKLEAAAREAAAGDLGVRVSPSPLADRDLQQLVDVFNRMLESVESSARRRREMALAILDAEERTRSRVSRDLYQDLAQHLATLLLSLPAASRRSRNGSAGADGEIVRRNSASGASRPNAGVSERQALRDEIHTALEKVREVARRLRPPELDELGLMPALEAEARILRERTGQAIHLERPDPVPDLEPEARLALFRILQEALVNAVRHAAADRIRLRVFSSEGEVVADVEDDGRGFDVPTTLTRLGAGPGLRAMMERARYVDGTVEVESSPGRGARVRARIPARGRVERTVRELSFQPDGTAS